MTFHGAFDEVGRQAAGGCGEERGGEDENEKEINGFHAGD
jgi:hypothetical protein